MLPVLMHGDAAFAGQGVVAETLNLSQLRGYRTGGTIHIVVNNQVGFTTSPTESRSSMYCTDVARMIQAPIFHVNGDDPEACIRVARLAFAFRQEFNKDVVIDLICYRRRGHNEGDDPSFTQPRMYDLIEKKRVGPQALHRGPDRPWRHHRRGRRGGDDPLPGAPGEWSSGRSVGRVSRARDMDYSRVPAYPKKSAAKHGTRHQHGDAEEDRRRAHHVPDGFTRSSQGDAAAAAPGRGDHSGPDRLGDGEIVALGSLLLEGRTVRLTGQDTRRGTFVQRFASIVDRKTGESWVPLKHLDDDQGKFHVFDSLLSEFAAMGFEYGYSVAQSGGAGALGGAVR